MLGFIAKTVFDNTRENRRHANFFVRIDAGGMYFNRYMETPPGVYSLPAKDKITKMKVAGEDASYEQNFIENLSKYQEVYYLIVTDDKRIDLVSKEDADMMMNL